jgi:hypothetical protein
MLPDSAFDPLDLDDLIETQDDLDSIADLIASALTDPRARGDDALEEYIQEYIETCRETDRQRDGIGTLGHLAELEPDLAGELTAEIAGLHVELGERDIALDLIRSYQTQQQKLPAPERDLSFYATAAVTAGDEAGDNELADTLLTEGTKLAQERKDRQALLTLEMAREHLRPTPGGIGAIMAELKREGRK